MMRIFVIVLLLSGLVGGASLYKWRVDRQEQAESQAQENREEEALKQKMLTFSIDGKTASGVKQWHLEGKAAEMIDDEIHLQDLDAIAYGDEFTVTLTSEKGVYRRKEGEVELFGNVRVLTEDGSLLTTERAKWSYNTKEITTDSLVDIKREDMHAIGTGARANNLEKTAVLLKDVTVEMEPATIIKCDGPLEADFGENIAIFRNNVRVQDKQGNLLADVMKVYIDSESSKISKVEAEGNVKLLKGKSYTLCEKAVYTDGTGSVKFIGKPRVVIAPQELAESGLLSGGGLLGGDNSSAK